MSHQFIKILELDKSVRGIGMAKVFGALVACPECGEVRKVWEDGVIEVAIKSKKPCQRPK